MLCEGLGDSAAAGLHDRLESTAGSDELLPFMALTWFRVRVRVSVTDEIRIRIRDRVRVRVQGEL